MANPTEAFAERLLLKPIMMIQKGSALPEGDYTVDTINAYIVSTNNETTCLSILQGTDTVNPSPVTSDLDTEGGSVVQAVDISSTPTLLGLNPTEYKALREKFNNEKVRIIKAYVEDIDQAKSSGEVILQENDVIEIGHIVDFSFFLNNVSGQEMQAISSYSKQLNAGNDTVAAWETIIANA